MSGVSLPVIQRMEASDGVVRCVVDTLIKVIEALDRAGVALIADNAVQREVEAGGGAEASGDRRGWYRGEKMIAHVREAKLRRTLHPDIATLRERYGLADLRADVVAGPAVATRSRFPSR